LNASRIRLLDFFIKSAASVLHSHRRFFRKNITWIKKDAKKREKLIVKKSVKNKEKKKKLGWTRYHDSDGRKTNVNIFLFEVLRIGVYLD